MSAKKQQSVLHVARYIVESIGHKNLTPLKLQKLAYYCQAWSMVWEEAPLFGEEFKAWANGPVCPQLYAKHRGTFSLEEDFLSEYSGHTFTPKDAKTIKSVIKYYGDKEPFYLSELTHGESPWILARKSTPPGASSSETITLESMQQYYGSL